ncbi:fumarylacetoacetate hydrolase family protein [Streptomyces morookaense]|uniref:Fumarylacetoacetate hydrolase family protein n=1 Tax=Streptomyces morookaense TaxID=1970 RepID=A0A7Y7BAJ3_STRMO|nr:fumarylacetoacetate hydrolase family protein [Streptomyces morookaense]NVK82033.1 fumarylacetoacetate hydrolase family protein [Streptomyces morookaense]GHF34231.1 fumarylacetoacetate (FAA) hydrolase [Streptomyces morookaense]
MSVNVLRTADGWYTVRGRRAVRVQTAAATTADLLADRDAVTAAVSSTDPGVPVADLAVLSPVTPGRRVVAQMTNFASHAADAGLDPKSVPLTFFRKASGSISGPYEDIVKPAHVRLLDYEVEIGLVIGAPLPVGTEVSAANLSGHVAALVVTNDVSARDLQLPRTQFYEAKSYPTFTPTGPALVLLEEGDLDRFAELRLRLWVNGELRQDMPASDMIHRPLEALRALSGFQRLDPGDLLLTGTPVGTALSAPPKPVELLGSLLPTATKWRLFFKAQAKNPKYLRDGDLVEAAVATDDGTLDLGRQRTTVRYAR